MRKARTSLELESNTIFQELPLEESERPLLKDALALLQGALENPEATKSKLRESATRWPDALAPSSVPVGNALLEDDPARAEAQAFVAKSDPNNRRFEKWPDALRFAASFVAAWMSNLFKDKADFPTHTSTRTFVYECDFDVGTTTLGLVGDFANGLPHSRAIIRWLASKRPNHFIYLGDVYYSGTSEEFAAYFIPDIEYLIKRNVAVWTMNANHEMFSKGIPFFDYIAKRKEGGQRQEGSYFCLRFGTSFQVIALDTAYHRSRRFTQADDNPQPEWLARQLKWGRDHGAYNVLLTPEPGFTHGKDAFSKLYDDLKTYLTDVDLWIWADDHYAGVFGPVTDGKRRLPVTACLGHGGSPYEFGEYELKAKKPECPAPSVFIENTRRYDEATNDARGNHGYCLMHLRRDGGRAWIELELRDWRDRERIRLEVARDAKGLARVTRSGG